MKVIKTIKFILNDIIAVWPIYFLMIFGFSAILFICIKDPYRNCRAVPHHPNCYKIKNGFGGTKLQVCDPRCPYSNN